jgi:S-layer family protein
MTYKNVCFAVLTAALAASASAADRPTGEPGAPLSASSEASVPGSGSSEPSQTFGGSDYVVVNYPAIAWTPLNDGEWGHFATSGWSQRNGGTNTTTCMDVHLPTGASWEGITTWTNDTDAAANITYSLFSVDLSTSTGTTPFTFTTTGAPGIERIYRPFGSPITVVNDRHSYALCIAHPAVGGTLQNAGATLWYKLQVAPAPATATFGDVPVGDSIHRFVEALAASGITGGCGGGNYCPTAPVTRGQMAVFLSAALGLHFPR